MLIILLTFIFATGLGLDEDTAAFFGPDETIEVVGSGAITVVDPSQLEFSSMDDCKLYGRNGELISEVKPQGEAPVIAGGDNTAEFVCEPPAGLNPRACVTWKRRRLISAWRCWSKRTMRPNWNWPWR